MYSHVQLWNFSYKQFGRKDQKSDLVKNIWALFLLSQFLNIPTVVVFFFYKSQK